MLIPRGSTNIYQWSIKLGNGLFPSVITGHGCMQFDDTGHDNSFVIASAAQAQYGYLLTHTTTSYFACQIEAHPVQARKGNAGGITFPGTIVSNTTPFPIYPEASLILRRVGATIPPHPTSRCLIGGLRSNLFTDLPRARHINNLDPQIVFALALMNNPVVWPSFLAHEVQFDRNTGHAWTIENYSVATRTGRVWQRAGYPHR